MRRGFLVLLGGIGKSSFSLGFCLDRPGWEKDGHLTTVYYSRVALLPLNVGESTSFPLHALWHVPSTQPPPALSKEGKCRGPLIPWEQGGLIGPGLSFQVKLSNAILVGNGNLVSPFHLCWGREERGWGVYWVCWSRDFCLPGCFSPDSLLVRASFSWVFPRPNPLASRCCQLL